MDECEGEISDPDYELLQQMLTMYVIIVYSDVF